MNARRRGFVARPSSVGRAGGGVPRYDEAVAFVEADCLVVDRVDEDQPGSSRVTSGNCLSERLGAVVAHRAPRVVRGGPRLIEPARPADGISRQTSYQLGGGVGSLDG